MANKHFVTNTRCPAFGTMSTFIGTDTDTYGVYGYSRELIINVNHDNVYIEYLYGRSRLNYRNKNSAGVIITLLEILADRTE